MNDPSVSSPPRDDTAIEAAEPEAVEAELASDLPEPELADSVAGDAASSDDHVDAAPTVDESIDLDAIERDLTDVQTALERLNDGSYWTDEVTGEALPDEVLASFPLTRTVAGSATT